MVAMLASISCALFGATMAETRIGVLPVDVAGAPDLGRALTTALVAEIRENAPTAEVFGPDDVEALLGPDRAAACVDVSCFGVMAAGAGVDELVLAKLVTLGPGDLLSLTLLDVRRNVVIGSVEDRSVLPIRSPAAGRQADGETQGPLDRLAAAAASLLAGSRPEWTPQVGFGRLEVLLDPWPVATGRVEKMVEIDLGRGPEGIGRLEVDTEPGTRIDLDGQTLGVAPLAPVAIATGSHRIHLVHGARAATVQVAVTSHSTVRVAPPLVTDLQ